MKAPSKKVQAFLWQLVGFSLGMLMIFSFLLTSGCAPVQPRATCPPAARDRIQATMVLERCTGAHCKMLMTVCMTEGDADVPRLQ